LDDLLTFPLEFTAKQKTVKSLDPKKNGGPIPRDVAPGNLLSVFSELGHQTKPDASAELSRVTGGRVIHYLKRTRWRSGAAIGGEVTGNIWSASSRVPRRPDNITRFVSR